MQRIKQDPEEDINISHTYNNNYYNKNNNQDCLNESPTENAQKMLPHIKRMKFEDHVEALKRFKEQYGHWDVQAKDDLLLHYWCKYTRSEYRKVKRGGTSKYLNSKRIQVLEDLGFDFKMKGERNTISLDSLPNSKVNVKCEDDDKEEDDNEGDKNDFSKDKNDKKDDKGQNKVPYQSFDDRIKELKEFKEKHGHLKIPLTYNRSLYRWCSAMRCGYKRLQNGNPSNCRLSSERIKILKDLGFNFLSFDQSFDDRIKALKEFKEKHGHLKITRKCDRSLYRWCKHMRSGYKRLQNGDPSNCRLSSERIKILKDLGFNFLSVADRNGSSGELSTQIASRDRTQKKDGVSRKGEVDDSDEDSDEDDEVGEVDDSDDDDCTEKENDNKDDKEQKKVSIQSFDDRIKELKQFKEKHGHLDIPWKCDRSLYEWCRHIRSEYKRVQNGDPSNCCLSSERIKILMDLGFNFLSVADRNGSSGELSTQIASRDRTQKKDRVSRKGEVDDSDEASDEDDEVGEEVDEEDEEEDEKDDSDDDDCTEKENDKKDNTEQSKVSIQSFDDRIKALKEFEEKHGHLDVPLTYNRSLYQWCSAMRSGYKRVQNGDKSRCGLSSERIKILKDLGFNFLSVADRNGSSGELSTQTASHDGTQKKDRVSKKGEADDSDEDNNDDEEDEVEKEDDSDDDDCTEKENDNKDDKEQNMVSIQSFDDRIKALKEFKEKHGHLDVPSSYNRSLYQWCSTMRSGYKRLQNGAPSRCGLSSERIKILKDLGFNFLSVADRNGSSGELSTQTASRDRRQKKDIDSRKSIQSTCSDTTEKISSFDINFNELKKFKEQYGHCEVPKEYSLSLSAWCSSIRSEYKLMTKGKPNFRLNPERVKLLEDIGFDFSSNAVSPSQRKKRKLSKISYPNQTSTHANIKLEQDVNNSISRPASPAFDIARYTYEELLQQAKENEAMCIRMEKKAKIPSKKSVKDIESSIFNSDDEDDSKGKFECRFCGLKFNFQCVCIVHMPKCKARTLNIKTCDS